MIEADPAVVEVAVTADKLTVELDDGRSPVVPLPCHPRLLHADDSERRNWHLLAGATKNQSQRTTVTRRKRPWLIVVGGVLLLLGLGLMARSCIPSSINPHQGDGVFEEHSSTGARLFMIPGYCISFPEFDLGKAYHASFRFSRMPNLGKKCGVYLAIRDPNDDWLERERFQQLQAKMDLELVDSRGATVIKVGGELREFTWMTEGSLHALYRTHGSFFTPDPAQQYTLRIDYSPDAKLATFKGYGYLLCGGHK